MMTFPSGGRSTGTRNAQGNTEGQHAAQLQGRQRTRLTGGWPLHLTPASIETAVPRRQVGRSLDELRCASNRPGPLSCSALNCCERPRLTRKVFHQKTKLTVTPSEMSDADSISDPSPTLIDLSGCEALGGALESHFSRQPRRPQRHTFLELHALRA